MPARLERAFLCDNFKSLVYYRCFRRSRSPDSSRNSFLMCRLLSVVVAMVVVALAGSVHAEVVSLPERPLVQDIPGMHVDARGYPEFTAIEWQLRLHAPQEAESPLYENAPSAEFELEFPTGKPVVLHWSKGSHSETSDFQPHDQQLSREQPISLESFGGRSSDGVMPYFNLAGDGGGAIVAIGWAGDWKASFEAGDAGKVRVRAGLKRSHFKLRPGEVARLPSLLVMAYRGDWIAGQNQFRRLMLQHYTPANHSPMELMPVAASVHGMLAFNDTTEENLKKLAGEIALLKLPIDTYWLDAGWNEGGFPSRQGTPYADPIRFPHGLSPVGDSVRQTGLRFLVWFEPERAMRGSWLKQHHPEWLLKPTATPADLRYMENDGFHLLDFGNPAARAWAIDAISKQISDSGIRCYRQDCNLYPSYCWHTDEAPDEVGLREIRHITGLYDFLDELARRHPGLILDNCAAGGRRLDFEMMRRSVVLWRSDSCWGNKDFPRNVQAMTHGLSHWIPLHGLGATDTDEVSLRSGMGACASFAINYRDATAVASLRNHLARYLPIRPLFASDFYPLTDWSADSNQWLAFEFHDPAKGEGIVQAFRGAGTANSETAFKLQGLDTNASYVLTDWDAPTSSTAHSGLDLMTKGISVSGQGKQQALVFHFKRQ